MATKVNKTFFSKDAAFQYNDFAMQFDVVM